MRLCIKCNIEQENEDFNKNHGNTCKSCVKKVSSAYYANNKHKQIQYKANKKLKQPPKAPKPPKAKEYKPEILIKEKNIRTPERLAAKNLANKLKIQIFQRNNNKTANIDREIYCSNKLWVEDNPVYYFDFDWLKDCPKEMLSIRFYKKNGNISKNLCK